MSTETSIAALITEAEQAHEAYVAASDALASVSVVEDALGSLANRTRSAARDLALAIRHAHELAFRDLVAARDAKVQALLRVEKARAAFTVIGGARKTPPTCAICANLEPRRDDGQL